MNSSMMPTSESRDVDIPPEFLSGPSQQPVILTEVPFASSAVPEYDGCFAVTLDNVLSPEECKQLIGLAEQSVPLDPQNQDASPWQPALVHSGPGQGRLAPGYRESDRIIWDNQDIVDRIWARCTQVAGLQERLASEEEEYRIWGKPKTKRTFQFARLNDRMRFLKYSKGNFFKPHCDGAYWFVRDDKEFETRFTVHLYLNDSVDVSPDSELVGGATGFLSSSSYERRLDINPKAGSVLIFQHEKLIHEGAMVKQGVKFTLRMDILYELLGKPN